MGIGKGPCFGCDRRALGCHDSCARYLEWKEEVEVIKQKKAEDNQSYCASRIAVCRYHSVINNLRKK